MAGGLTKKKAKDIYVDSMSNILALEGLDEQERTAFELVRDEILFKWYPHALKNAKIKR